MVNKMITFTDDEESIVSLWQQAFGDSKEDILFFLKNCKNKKCLAFTEEKTLYSMLFLVDCTLNGKPSKYVYAACTDKNFKNQGYMSALLDFCKENYSSVCLIPANNDLVGYYYNRGFNKEQPTNKLYFNENKEICEYLFEGCTLEKPFVMQYIGG